MSRKHRNLPQAEGAEIRRAKRWPKGFGFNNSFGLVLALILWLMVNYIGANYYLRGDWSHTKLYELSDKTVQLLETVDQPVDITMVFESNDRFYAQVDNLLREYQVRNPKINLFRVDPLRHPAQMAELKRTYNLKQKELPQTEQSLGRNPTPEDAAQVIVASGTRWKAIARDEIFVEESPEAKRFSLNGESDLENMVGRGSLSFHGEALFSSAIQEVTSKEKAQVYFLLGHGEHNPDNFEHLVGYSKTGRRLSLDNIDVHVLGSGLQTDVPSDCDVLIVAGPNSRIPQVEMDMIDRYLKRRGRALFLLDTVASREAESGCESLLLNYGVQVGNDVLIPSDRTYNRKRFTLSRYEVHPITESLTGYSTDFFAPRSVRAYGSNEVIQIEPLASCGPEGWAETDIHQVPAVFDEATDIAGPVSFAVAVEIGGADPGIDISVDPFTRLVVIGDSDFAANGSRSAGSDQFFINAVNWLLGREYLVAAAPKSMDLIKLNIPYNNRMRLFLSVILGLPLSMALVGLLVWGGRRG